MSAEVPERDLDLSNAQMVGRNGYGEISIAFPRALMTVDEALVHAAWLVLACGGEDEFGKVLAAVRGEQ